VEASGAPGARDGSDVLERLTEIALGVALGAVLLAAVTLYVLALSRGPRGGVPTATDVEVRS
jgi:hypothetical protein